jgi:prephenate dehydrogenase
MPLAGRRNPTAEEMVMSEVIVVIGAGLIGQAIARRVSAGKHGVLSDLHQENAAGGRSNVVVVAKWATK